MGRRTKGVPTPISRGKLKKKGNSLTNEAGKGVRKLTNWEEELVLKGGTIPTNLNTEEGKESIC